MSANTMKPIQKIFFLQRAFCAIALLATTNCVARRVPLIVIQSVYSVIRERPIKDSDAKDAHGWTAAIVTVASSHRVEFIIGEFPYILSGTRLMLIGREQCVTGGLTRLQSAFTPLSRLGTHSAMHATTATVWHQIGFRARNTLAAITLTQPQGFNRPTIERLIAVAPQHCEPPETFADQIGGVDGNSRLARREFRRRYFFRHHGIRITVLFSGSARLVPSVAAPSLYQPQGGESI